MASNAVRSTFLVAAGAALTRARRHALHQPVLTENPEGLALGVLRAFVVIAAPAAFRHAVDFGHDTLAFCHCASMCMQVRA